jgi:hypothetical protein
MHCRYSRGVEDWFVGRVSSSTWREVKGVSIVVAKRAMYTDPVHDREVSYP